MKKLSLLFIFYIAVLLLPAVALADVTNLSSLVGQLQTIFTALVPLLFGIALIGFLVGVVRYIWAAGNPAKIKEARGFIVFSIVGMAVMLSVWSLALFVKNSFFPSAPVSINFGSGSITQSGTIGSVGGGTTGGVSGGAGVTNTNPFSGTGGASGGGSTGSTGGTGTSDNGGGQDQGECLDATYAGTPCGANSIGVCNAQGGCVSPTGSIIAQLTNAALNIITPLIPTSPTDEVGSINDCIRVYNEMKNPANECVYTFIGEQNTQDAGSGAPVRTNIQYCFGGSPSTAGANCKIIMNCFKGIGNGYTGISCKQTGN